MADVGDRAGAMKATGTLCSTLLPSRAPEVACGFTRWLPRRCSVPAVFGVTDEPYIVFVANAFALLGLRALYFLVKGLLDRLVYLSTGLSRIPAFIGVKLILHWAHVDIDASVPEISTPVSLFGDRRCAAGRDRRKSGQDPA
ncbi:TerC family protein [Streptomyces sp. NRRL S-146]|uniref:TerC family protein n=1 Tax=Streptomyces sp. NRRL S-146 TaxID=1463884 RepID=UPI0004C8BAA0